MPTNVLLPQWGMNMQEGTVVRWLKQPGDAVREGEPLAEIETAKINSELEAPASGVLAHVAVPEGATVGVGSVLAIIGAPGEDVAAPPSQAPARPSATPRPPTEPRQAAPAHSTGAAAQVVPAARRLAREHDIDLGAVPGSGPGGRILEADVEAALAARSAPTAEGVPLSGMRRAIAESMMESVRTTAPVTLMVEADVTAAAQLREDLVGRWRAERTRPLALSLLVKAVARALAKNPDLNATLVGGRLRRHDDVAIGFAVAVPEGLILPVVRDAHERSLLEVNRDLMDLASRARKGELTPSELSGAAFTITDLGGLEIDTFTPILVPPQVAILGVGREVEKPVVRDGQIVVRSMMALSLTFDHQATDGAPSGRFLQGVKRGLEDPGWMVE